MHQQNQPMMHQQNQPMAFHQSPSPAFPPHIFVANFPYYKTDADLEDTFGCFGEMSACYLVPDKRGGHRGFGFVSYLNPRLSFGAALYFRGHQFRKRNGAASKPLDVDLTNQFKVYHCLPTNRRFEQRDMNKAMEAIKFLASQKPLHMQPGQTPQAPVIGKKNGQMPHVFFSNVHYSVNEDNLAGIFSKYGQVTQLYLVNDQEGGNRHKGFGFLSFLNAGSAEKCVVEMKDFELRGRKMAIDFSQKYKSERK